MTPHKTQSPRHKTDSIKVYNQSNNDMKDFLNLTYIWSFFMPAHLFYLSLIRLFVPDIYCFVMLAEVSFNIRPLKTKLKVTTLPRHSLRRE